MERETLERMKRFFSPEHIAVIGASEKSHWFGNILRNASRIGFEGTFYPVNPNASEVAGIRAYSSIEDLPDGLIDFAVIIVNTKLVLKSIEKLCRKGIRDMLLVSSGYAEMGDDGVSKQEELTRYCRENDIRLMGPNCLGFMNFSDKVSVFTGGAVQGELTPGQVAVLGQSGASTEIMVTKILAKRLGISLYAATGNEAMLTTEDCMEYLVNDGHTRVITGFIETFRDIPRMKRIALEAAEKQIPIVLIKIGRSERAVKAASSHTGAMAGNDAVMEGFFRQHGIIRVDTVEELVQTAGIFSRCRLPRGGGLCVCTVSGGLCGLYADLCSRYGIDLPRLSERTAASLKAILPDFAQPDNPLDVTGSGFSKGLSDVIRILLDDESIDLIVPFSFTPDNKDDVMPHLFNETIIPYVDNPEKPIIAMAFREVNDYARGYYHEKGMCLLEHAEDGFKAVSHFIQYAQFQKGLAMEKDQGSAKQATRS